MYLIMFYKQLILLLAVLAAVVSSYAQDSLWSRAYGGFDRDVCAALLPVDDGGYLLAGSTVSFGLGMFDMWLLRIDSLGDSVSSHTYGGTNSDGCNAVVAAADGGFLLAGYTDSYGSGNKDFWLVKTDDNGDSLWSRTYGGTYFDFCYDIQPAVDGGYILAGRTSSFGAGNSEFWMVRVNDDGDSLWSRTFGTPYSDECLAVCCTPDGGFALAGSVSAAPAGNRDFWLIKTDANGDSLWSRACGGSHYDECYAMVPAADGGFLLGGYTCSFGSASPEDPHAWLLKVDSNGDSLWSLISGGNNQEFWNTIKLTPAGCMTAGVSYSFGNGSADFWLMETDAAGDSLWSRTFGGEQGDYCYDLVPAANGSRLAAGSTASYGSGIDDAWLISVGPGQSSPLVLFVPTSCTLYPIYPNPFNSNATIAFDLVATGCISLRLFTVEGRLVRTVFDGVQPPGHYVLPFDGAALASGTYLCCLTSGPQSFTQKAILIK